MCYFNTVIFYLAEQLTKQVLATILCALHLSDNKLKYLRHNIIYIYIYTYIIYLLTSYSVPSPVFNSLP
jgi:hypothetical protein